VLTSLCGAFGLFLTPAIALRTLLPPFFSLCYCSTPFPSSIPTTFLLPSSILHLCQPTSLPACSLFVVRCSLLFTHRHHHHSLFHHCSLSRGHAHSDSLVLAVARVTPPPFVEHPNRWLLLYVVTRWSTRTIPMPAMC
jgi:hypothetical protein